MKIQLLKLYITAMIFLSFIISSAVQIYEFSYIHYHPGFSWKYAISLIAIIQDSHGNTLFHSSLNFFMLFCTIRDYNVLFEHRELFHYRIYYIVKKDEQFVLWLCHFFLSVLFCSGQLNHLFLVTLNSCIFGQGFLVGRP